MAIIESLTFDTLADNSLFASDSPWALVGYAPTIAVAAKIHGKVGCRYSTGEADSRIQYNFGAPLSQAYVFSFYYRVPSFSASNQFIAGVLTPTGSFQSEYYVTTDHSTRIRDDVAEDSWDSGTITTGTVYRVEWMVDPIGQTQELRRYVGESTTPETTTSGSFTSTAGQVFGFGPISGGVIDYDTIRIADDWVGPYQPRVGFRIYRYNGTAWV